jgi:hypothetical protein
MGSEWILGRLVGERFWNGLNWLRIGAGDGLLWMRWWTLGFWRHWVYSTSNSRYFGISVIYKWSNFVKLNYGLPETEWLLQAKYKMSPSHCLNGEVVCYVRRHERQDQVLWFLPATRCLSLEFVYIKCEKAITHKTEGHRNVYIANITCITDRS